jgi:CRP-like cAMP-binding protein
MKNFLLGLFSPSDSKLLAPHLKQMMFEQRRVLFDADEQIRHVYFPIDAVVSLVITLSTGETVEAAVVGNDGVVGASAALDGKVSLSRGIIQLGGEIIVCDIDALKSTALQSPKLLALLIRHEQTVYA